MEKADIVGQRFGKLTVIEDSGKRDRTSVLWRCKCDCGGEILARRYQLTSGVITNCGCIPKKRASRGHAEDLTGQLPKIDIGYRVGILTVEGKTEQRRQRYTVWRCKCDCGGEMLLNTKQLQRGTVKDCGCIPKKRAPHGEAENLTGRQFGALTVLRRVENDANNQTCWLCQCSCGNLHTVAAKKLKSGHTQSCGCKQQRAFYGKDLTGQQFGRLTALHLVKTERPELNRQRTTWHCQCDCGNEIDVTADNLLTGITQSCGCINDERAAKLFEYQHYMENSCIERVVRALNEKTENKAGFRGLSLKKDGRYYVNIQFQKVHYYLGRYKSFDEAVQARLEAEETLHVGFINAYERWKKQADVDPEWAEENPFFYRVQRVRGEFEIATNAPDYVSAGDLLMLSERASG